MRRSRYRWTSGRLQRKRRAPNEAPAQCAPGSYLGSGRGRGRGCPCSRSATRRSGRGRERKSATFSTFDATLRSISGGRPAFSRMSHGPADGQSRKRRAEAQRRRRPGARRRPVRVIDHGRPPDPPSAAASTPGEWLALPGAGPRASSPPSVAGLGVRAIPPPLRPHRARSGPTGLPSLAATSNQPKRG